MLRDLDEALVVHHKEIPSAGLERFTIKVAVDVVLDL
jgi:hypothetical protein